MAAIRAANGQLVTDEMIDTWCESLDSDEWPSGWVNVGDVVHGPRLESRLAPRVMKSIPEIV